MTAYWLVSERLLLGDQESFPASLWKRSRVSNVKRERNQSADISDRYNNSHSNLGVCLHGHLTVHSTFGQPKGKRFVVGTFLGCLMKYYKDFSVL